MRDDKCLNWFVIFRHSKRVKTTNKADQNTPKTPHFIYSFIFFKKRRGVKNALNIPTDFLIIVMHVTVTSPTLSLRLPVKNKPPEFRVFAACMSVDLYPGNSRRKHGVFLEVRVGLQMKLQNVQKHADSSNIRWFYDCGCRCVLPHIFLPVHA